MKIRYIKFSVSILSILLFAAFFFSCKKDVLYPTSTTIVVTDATADINSILFVNDTLGYIAGGDKYNSTELLTTHDNGKTWQRFNLSVNDSKEATSIAYNGYKATAVGYEGKFYTPATNSNNWQVIQTPNWGVWYQHIAFSNPNKGFIVSGEAYVVGKIFQIDSSFNLQLKDSFPYELCDIAFANDQIGYTCGYGAVMKTEDGGISWDLQNIQGDFFRSMSIVDPQNVWIAGYNGSIIHTKDGGAHWEKQRNGDNPLLAKYRFRGICFKDLNTGYAVGDKGLIMKTSDGGVHWSLLEKTTDKDLKCITIQKDGSLWIGGTQGLVLHIIE